MKIFNKQKYFINNEDIYTENFFQSTKRNIES